MRFHRHHHLPRRHLAPEIGAHLIAIGRKQRPLQRNAREQTARPGDGDNIRPHLKRGYEYYRGTFFGSDGRPAYYHNRRHPVDIQCAAQAIDTFCLFADADAGALPRARLIAEWTIRNMQEPDGHFIHRRYPLLRAATPYFHWGQATMFHALAHLIFQCARRPVATLS